MVDGYQSSAISYQSRHTPGGGKRRDR